MATTKKASLHGARRVTTGLDRMASVIQEHFAALGLPQKVALDFAYRCDLLSDAIQGQYGEKNAAFFNPAEIAEEVPGPLINDPTQGFMNGHFKQDKFVQLGEKQESGELATHAEKHEADPRMASLIAKATKLATAQVLRDLGLRVAAEEEEVTEETKVTEEPKKEAAKEEPKKEDAKDDAKEDAKPWETGSDADKTARLFGLFDTK